MWENGEQIIATGMHTTEKLNEVQTGISSVTFIERFTVCVTNLMNS